MEHEPQGGGNQPNDYRMTLLKAVELGEYDPQVLARFPEWHQLGRHAQFQLVRKGLTNRNFQLQSTWGEINNQLNFSKKPHLHQALRNIEKQIHELREEEDRLFVEFTKV
ncbi:hypothetical protein C5B42_04150 [Candidatus Cerribacteria bacterium 'Amazon FNV 2010 28 9']|uniref:Uncharacterized protein n=1 Tax=Candidatus Cerribacteria bacterium 'Amazon FNV 2010 28 9' TaxID=2081795 RepID=A0A317JPM4_9BACT|nr:MAG: hypothetical protein C5B42_04150 [Candidatus Cerribacteria bacterium 'Amazon FNV 2010 28 9']